MAEELTPETIHKRKEAHLLVTDALRQRMQDDYETYRLNWTDSRLESKDPEYQIYISNEPRTYAKRMMSWLADAVLIPRVPLEMMATPERAKAQANEHFVVGALREADKRLARLFQLPLREELAFHISMRGMSWGRALLVKAESGETKVDVSPFDPMHTYWGRDADDLAWVIHHQMRSRDELIAEYGRVAEEILGGNHGHMGIDVYDYYDGKVNAVCLKDRWLKEPTPHYSPVIPIFRVAVGFTPVIVSKDGVNDQQAWEHYGESIYDENREVYDQFNKTMSDMMTLVRQAVRPSFTVKSREGKKLLKKSPFPSGAQIALRLEEEVKTLDAIRMSLDTGPFLAQVGGEIQRGSISRNTYGEIPFQLAGYAIALLGKSTSAVLVPRVIAMANVYRQIADLLRAQYHQGGFQNVRFAGRGRDRNYFLQEFTPDEIDPSIEMEVSLQVDLPQDEMQRYAMAQIAKKEGFLSDRTIQDRLLQIPDVDAERDMIKEEMAEKASPQALLMGFIESAVKRGRPDLVEVYVGELARILQERAIQEAKIQGMMGGMEGPVPGGGEGGGMRPEVMPNAMQGKMPPTPVPQGPLPLVAPGTPRAPRPGTAGFP